MIFLPIPSTHDNTKANLNPSRLATNFKGSATINPVASITKGTKAM